MPASCATNIAKAVEIESRVDVFLLRIGSTVGFSGSRPSNGFIVLRAPIALILKHRDVYLSLYQMVSAEEFYRQLPYVDCGDCPHTLTPPQQQQHRFDIARYDPQYWKASDVK